MDSMSPAQLPGLLLAPLGVAVFLRARAKLSALIGAVVCASMERGVFPRKGPRLPDIWSHVFDYISEAVLNSSVYDDVVTSFLICMNHAVCGPTRFRSRDI